MAYQIWISYSGNPKAEVLKKQWSFAKMRCGFVQETVNGNVKIIDNIIILQTSETFRLRTWSFCLRHIPYEK